MYSNQGTQEQSDQSRALALAAALEHFPNEPKEDVEYAVYDIFSNDVECDQDHLFKLIQDEYLIDYN